MPDFSGYYEHIVVKTVWYWHKDRQTNRTRVVKKKFNIKWSTELFFFCKCTQRNQREKERFFNNGTGTVEYLNGKKYVSSPLLHIIYKN